MLHTLSDELLVEQIREGDPDAWAQLIERYEGRLLAFVGSRLRDAAAAEDVVQEAFVGFLTSLPHYDGSRALESYLFGIAAHKLSDHLRRQGRRPAVSLSESAFGSPDAMRGPARRASSIVRSAEQRGGEEAALAKALADFVDQLKDARDFPRLQCLELLWVRGWPNKTVAQRLDVSEQTVANQKFQAIAKLRKAVAGTTPPDLSDDTCRERTPWRSAVGETAGEQPGSSAASPSRPLAASPSDAELLAYLDEDLPAAEMSHIEDQLRGDSTLRRRLADCSAQRDRGGHTLGEIWRRWRVTCPPRTQLGSYLLDALEPALHDYITFHLTLIGCRPCHASLHDLRTQHSEAPTDPHPRRQRFFQSSAGYLRRS